MRESPLLPAPPFAVLPQAHTDCVCNAIAQLYQNSGEATPIASHPIAPLHRLVEACDLNSCELPLLSKQSAMQWLLKCGGLRRAWTTGPDCDARIAGFLYANAAGGCIFVEANNPISRRRFSAAHELGHYLLHFLPHLHTTSQQLNAEAEWLELEPNANSSRADASASTCSAVEAASQNIAAQLPYAQSEAQADAFAAELLMPHDLVSERAANARAHWGDADLVWRLSQEFLVSRKAMWVRLRHLGWLDGGVAYEAVG